MLISKLSPIPPACPRTSRTWWIHQTGQSAANPQKRRPSQHGCTVRHMKQVSACEKSVIRKSRSALLIAVANNSCMPPSVVRNLKALSPFSQFRTRSINHCCAGIPVLLGLRGSPRHFCGKNKNQKHKSKRCLFCH